MLKISHAIQILQQVFKKLNLSFTVQLDVRCGKSILHSETLFWFLKDLSPNLGSM